MSKEKLLILMGKIVVYLSIFSLILFIIERKYLVDLYISIFIIFLALYCKLWNMKYPKSITTSPFFKNKKVMIIVPHPDDELNVAGGIIRDYMDNGSEVFIVFTTNFDTYGRNEAEKRFKEILKLYKYLGIDRKRIFFTGFGSTHIKQTDGIMCYDSKKIYMSIAGHNETYGICGVDTISKIIYGKEIKYNYLEFTNIIRDIILKIKPDDIYCVDYDIHIDHRIASVACEEVMDVVIKEKMYIPNIFKGFAYATSWNANKDFYNEKFRVDMVEYCNSNSSYLNHFNWENRVCLPYLNANQLGVTLRSCNLYKLYSFYKSQNALSHTNQAINADQVFWKLPTENVFCGGNIEVSSGEEKGLFSIKQLFVKNFNQKEPSILAGGVKFEREDKDKFIRILFDSEIEFRRLTIILAQESSLIKKVKVRDNQNSTEDLYDLDMNNSKTVIIDCEKTLCIKDLTISFEAYTNSELVIRRIVATNESKPIVLKISSLNKKYLYYDMEGLGWYCITNEYGEVQKIAPSLSVLVKDFTGKMLPFEIVDNYYIKIPPFKRKFFLSIEGIGEYKGYKDRIVIHKLNKVNRYLISKLVMFEQFIDAILVRLRSHIYDRNHSSKF